MASGWHLHQSLRRPARPAPTPSPRRAGAGQQRGDATHALSDVGEHWLAGLLAHGRGMAVFCAPTINAYGRFRPNAMAPQAVRLGPRQPRRDAARARPRRRRRHAHREPHRRADAPIPTSTSRRRSTPGSTACERGLRGAAGDRGAVCAPAPTGRCRRRSARRSTRWPPTSALVAAFGAPVVAWFGQRQALRARRATTRPTTRTPGRRASTSAASEEPTAQPTITDPPDRGRRPRSTTLQARGRAEPDARRGRRRHRRHQGRLRRLHDLRHLPRLSSTTAWADRLPPPSSDENAMLEMTAAPSAGRTAGSQLPDRARRRARRA